MDARERKWEEEKGGPPLSSREARPREETEPDIAAAAEAIAAAVTSRPLLRSSFWLPAAAIRFLSLSLSLSASLSFNIVLRAKQTKEEGK